MERAGHAVAEVVLERFPGRVPWSAAAATTAATAASAPRASRGRPRGDKVEAFGEFGEPDVIVDALLGIGLRRCRARTWPG